MERAVELPEDELPEQVVDPPRAESHISDDAERAVRSKCSAACLTGDWARVRAALTAACSTGTSSCIACLSLSTPSSALVHAL